MLPERVIRHGQVEEDHWHFVGVVDGAPPATSPKGAAVPSESPAASL